MQTRARDHEFAQANPSFESLEFEDNHGQRHFKCFTCLNNQSPPPVILACRISVSPQSQTSVPTHPEASVESLLQSLSFADQQCRLTFGTMDLQLLIHPPKTSDCRTTMVGGKDFADLSSLVRRIPSRDIGASRRNCFYDSNPGGCQTNNREARERVSQ